MNSSLKLDKSQIHLKIRYGSEGPKRQKASGRWPMENKKSSYDLSPMTVKLGADRNILSGSVISSEDIFLREIELSFKVQSRQNRLIHYCGCFPGSPVLTVSDSQGIIRFKRNKKMKQIISFCCKPGRHSITIRWNFNCRLSEGEKLSIDPILISERSAGLQPALKKAVKSESPGTPRTAWVSYNSEKRGIRLSALEENLDWMEKERFFFDMIRLDNIHSCRGDWETLHADFRGKIGFINRRIEHNGMIPGISFSPFLADSGSDLVRIHPDWLVGDLKSESPLTRLEKQQKFYILDFTRDAVKQYLTDTLDLFRKQWGFKAFHLTGLSSLQIPGRRLNAQTSGGSLLYEALSLIRNTLGADTFISAEDIPYITQDGQISMIEEKPQISSPRKSRKEIPLGIFRILEQSYTSHYPWILNPGHYPLPDDKENYHPQAGESLRQMILLNGGFLSINQDLSSFSEELKQELKNLIPSFNRFTGGRLHFLNSPDRKEPNIVFNSAGYLGVFNLSSRKKHISLNMEELKEKIYNRMGESHIREGRTGMNTGILELILPPFGSRIFKF